MSADQLLESALCELSSVVSKMAGSASVLAMVEAMIAGQRDPRVLADLAQTAMRGKLAALEQAFTGTARPAATSDSTGPRPRRSRYPRQEAA